MVRPTLITRNFMLKIFSLVVALLIFLFVSVESGTSVEVDFQIDYRINDDIMITGNPPEFVHATLQGPWANFRSFETKDLTPYVVDLSGAEPDTHTRPILTEDIKPPAGMRVVAFRPAEIEVTIERKIERPVPVEADIMDRPAFGYAILAVHIEPREVRVVGPRSKVGTLDFISTRPLNVDGQTEDLTLEAELRQPAAGVRLLERRVRVVIEISEEFVTRSFSNVRVTLDNAPKGTRVSPSPLTVSLKGPRRLVDSMDPKTLEVYVDCKPEIDEGRRSFDKAVTLRTAPERTVLVSPIPSVVVQLPKARRRKR